MKKYLILLLVIALTNISCDKESERIQLNINEYLIFGKYYFECGGNCVNLFKLENGKIYEDNLDWGLPEEIPFLETPLDDDKFQIAKVLIEDFPDDLLQSSKRKYGCPDCVDQGGFYIELNKNGEREIWLIDVWDNEQNQAIINYKNRIDEVLNEI